MRIVGLCGASGSGKTTLAERLIESLRSRGCRVSVVKHAHKRFDIDHPGKDSHRHREAGAFEVLVANNHRLALMREFDAETAVSVHDLLSELSDLGDDHWVLVEGFKHADILKIEVWRAQHNARAVYPDDPFVVALATADDLPQATGLPVYAPDDAAGLADFLLAHATRFQLDPH